MRLFEDITKTIGNTPLVKLNKVTRESLAEIYGKCEFFNPLGSVKDRIALSMIEEAERDGRLQPGGVVVEPTSGNTGIGLAFICAAKGYRLKLYMPETTPLERRAHAKILGAEIELTPGFDGMLGAIKAAEDYVESDPNAFMPQQFKNPANPAAHFKTTAEEIWRDTDGKIDIFVAGIGTGGTVTGVGEALKKKKSSIHVVGLEPASSAILTTGQSGNHKIQGIGAGFVPDVLNRGIIDEIITVPNQQAFLIAKDMAKYEGILAGISSGANVWGSIQIGKRPENEGKMIVTILCDSGERYLNSYIADLP